jgi:hypothetical protein
MNKRGIDAIANKRGNGEPAGGAAMRACSKKRLNISVVVVAERPPTKILRLRGATATTAAIARERRVRGGALRGRRQSLS